MDENIDNGHDFHLWTLNGEQSNLTVKKGIFCKHVQPHVLYKAKGMTVSMKCIFYP